MVSRGERACWLECVLLTHPGCSPSLWPHTCSPQGCPQLEAGTPAGCSHWTLSSVRGGRELYHRHTAHSHTGDGSRRRKPYSSSPVHPSCSAHGPLPQTPSCTRDGGSCHKKTEYIKIYFDRHQPYLDLVCKSLEQWNVLLMHAPLAMLHGTTFCVHQYCILG